MSNFKEAYSSLAEDVHAMQEAHSSLVEDIQEIQEMRGLVRTGLPSRICGRRCASLRRCSLAWQRTCGPCRRRVLAWQRTSRRSRRRLAWKNLSVPRAMLEVVQLGVVEADQHSACLVGPMHLIVLLSHAEGSSRAQLRHPDKRQVSKMASAQCPKDFRKPDPSVCPLHKPSLKTAMSSGHHAPSVRLRAVAPVFLRDWAELLLSQ
ncbi:hypothetical protein Q9966_012332 [Columba livia]|nr:hypothetical protein Q9966_012322 [Columba livia]KAK2522677.1 hypothetical protein Q9966_012332 [Columba livia]